MDYNCEKCNAPCVLQLYNQGMDKYRWQCNVCKFSKSVRHGSFFSGSHLSLSTITLLIYMWSHCYSSQHIILELKVEKSCVIDWRNFCRDVTMKWKEESSQIGGITPDLEMKIVESAFGKRKHHRGRRQHTRWVVGGIERGSKRCFVEEVLIRDVATLDDVIKKWVAPGSRVVTDGWRGYNNIANIDNGIYAHDVVIHQENFVNPLNSDIHTQNVESMWNRMKRFMRRINNTSSRHLFPSYVSEFMWRCSIGDNVFMEFLVEINVQYPL
jgi:transposase-like protein